MSVDKAPRVAFSTLGCKVNQSEAGALAQLFAGQGYRVVPFEEKAEVYVIHTCTVTHLSDRKCRQAIRRAVRKNPGAIVAVSGCYAQVAPEEIASIPGVTIVVGSRERNRLVELVDRVRASGPLCLVTPWEVPAEFEEMPPAWGDRARPLVRIEEGCQERCSYCIVPLARGPVRSRHPAQARAEVERLIRAGYQEIVLTGVNLGAYGRDLGGTDLTGLLKELLTVPGLGRIRLSSVEPHYFSRELIELVSAEAKICPHWHIPLQSGHADTLSRMGRRYSPDYYASLVERIRRARPGAAITTDVIVGFPGENQLEFEQTLSFVESMAFSRLHVFPFSPRRDTPASLMPNQVPRKVKEERSARLRALGQDLAQDYASRFVGKELEVVVEDEIREKTGWVRGHSENYLMVTFQGDSGLVGRMVPVRAVERNGDALTGVRVGETLDC